jgi:hypothetical protein
VVAWQVITMAVLVLLPIALMLDFHPHGERLGSRGQPLERPWRRGRHPDPDAAHAEIHH